MPRGRRRLLLLLSLLLSVPSCFSQTPMTGRLMVSGSVRVEGSSQVISGARVQVLNAMGTPISSVYTDGKGTYQIDDVMLGNFYMVVEHEGYASVQEFVQPGGSPRVYKDVFLRPLGPGAAAKSVSPVSKRELSIPAKARQSFNKGVELVVSKSDYRGAINQFSHAIHSYPDYYEAYAAIGLAQFKMGDTPAAEASFRKSIKLSEEKYPQAMVDLASMLNTLKRYSDAEPVLRKLVELDATSWRGQYELAVALQGQNRFKEAVGSASAAHGLQPANPQTCLLLYNLHIHIDDFRAALRDTDDYLKLSPDGPMADRVRNMRAEVEKALQTPSSATAPPSPPLEGTGASLKIGLRLADNTAFDGSATVRLIADSGSIPSQEKPDNTSGRASDVSFQDVQPGSYSVEASAPGFATVKQNIEVRPDRAPDVVVLTMKPEAPDDHDAASGKTASTEIAAPATNDSVIPARVDEFIPEVAVAIPCSLSAVMRGAAQRAEQLLSSLQKFDASERVENYKVSGSGIPRRADVRSFDYVVAVSLDGRGGFHLQEFRDGLVARASQFPSGIRTANLAVHGLIFHPSLAPGFNFACEGLGEWNGRPAWLIHFDEKPNQPNPFRSYEINGVPYPVLLTGRAWIDAENYQVVRLESDLLKPIERIHLTREHIAIEFASVQFRTRSERLWLPQTADLYFELEGHRFYRRHTFSNFKLFSTDAGEQVSAPKESYCFRNTSDSTITGVLSATPVSGSALKPASLTLTIPAQATVCKSVGTGKDIDIPVASLASTTFAHNGPAGSIEVDAYQLDANALEIIPNRGAAAGSTPNR